MMLDLIGALRGEAMANEVAKALVHSRRNAEVEQRSAEIIESDRPLLAGLVVRLMQENLDFQLSLTELAEAEEIPPRTLFCVCNKVLRESLMKLNLKVCLQAAKKSPFYEDRSIKDVGLAFDFFILRCFRGRFTSSLGKHSVNFGDDCEKL